MNILIIDGYYFFRAVQEPLKHDYSQDWHVSDTVNALISSFEHKITNKFREYVDLVFFVRDTKSWRKQVSIERTAHINSIIKSDKYKGNRVKDKSVDWAKAFSSLDKFIDILNNPKYGIKTLSIDGAEGDDLFYILSMYFAKQGDNVILWTSDQDADAMVKENVHLYKPQRDTFYVSNYEQTCDVPLFGMVYNPSFLDRLLSGNNYVVLNPSDVDRVILERATMGMEKENIYGCITWQNGNRKARATARHITKALKSIKNKYPTFNRMLIFDDEFISLYINSLYVHCAPNVVPTKNNIDESIRVFKSNVRLLIMSKYTIPKSIIMDAYNNVKDYRTYKLTDFRAISGIDSIENTDIDDGIKYNNNIIDNLMQDY